MDGNIIKQYCEYCFYIDIINLNFENYPPTCVGREILVKINREFNTCICSGYDDCVKKHIKFGLSFM